MVTPINLFFMDKELKTKVQDNDHRKSLADLATELLVIIMSYLPARDKINTV